MKKMVIIERAKFAALARDYRKALNIILLMQHICQQKRVNLTMTLDEVCEILHLDKAVVEQRARHGRLRYDEDKGRKVYTVTDMLNLRDSIDSQKIYLQTRTGAIPDKLIHIK